MEILKHKDFTRYIIHKEEVEIFRITEWKKDVFHIEKSEYRLVVVKKGFLFDDFENKEFWERVDGNGQFKYELNSVNVIKPSLGSLLTFHKKEHAIEWLENYEKYPIYH